MVQCTRANKQSTKWMQSVSIGHRSRTVWSVLQSRRRTQYHNLMSEIDTLEPRARICRASFAFRLISIRLLFRALSVFRAQVEHIDILNFPIMIMMVIITYHNSFLPAPAQGFNPSVRERRCENSAVVRSVRACRVRWWFYFIHVFFSAFHHNPGDRREYRPTDITRIELSHERWTSQSDWPTADNTIKSVSVGAAASHSRHRRRCHHTHWCRWSRAITFIIIRRRRYRRCTQSVYFCG